MAVNQRQSGTTPAQSERISAQPDKPVSRAAAISYSLVAMILFGWFLYGWLVLRQGFVDSIGESAGTAFALLLGISIVGTLRQNRR